MFQAILMDERKGRRIAREHGLDPIGTITVLELAAERGLLDLGSRRREPAWCPPSLLPHSRRPPTRANAPLAARVTGDSGAPSASRVRAVAASARATLCSN